VAVKKKSAVKKVAKKASAKRAVKKVVKKSAAKKSAAKKSAAKKSTAKKSVAKKSAAKKSAAKKAPAKRTAKKASARTLPARASVTRTPVAPVVAKPVVPTSKPVVAPKQSTSGRVVLLVVVGIVILAAIVWSKSASKDDGSITPAPTISQSAEPTDSASAEPTETVTTVTSVEAPSKFVALKSADGLMLRWIAPMAVDGLTGFNVEIRASGLGDWSVIATLPADQLTQSVVKSSDNSWTQFRVSSVYSDGQIASATVFGIPGEFK